MQELPPFDAWQPTPPEAIATLVAPFEHWWLCGGHTIDWLVGRTTRDHGDTDIGVYRREAETCLAAIGTSRVYLADPPGELRAWDGRDVPDHVNYIWILSEDARAWVLQIML